MENFYEKYKKDIDILLSDKRKIDNSVRGAHSHWYTYVCHEDSRVEIIIDDFVLTFNKRLNHCDPRFKLENDSVTIVVPGWFIFKKIFGLFDCPLELQKRLDQLVSDLSVEYKVFN